MGHGQELKTRTEPQIEILERGEIYFFYRPKVDKEAHSPDDVQRFHIVLRPDLDLEPEDNPRHSGKEGQAKPFNKKEEVNVETQPLLRLIIMGRKSLPDPSKKGRPYWGFVDMVTTTIEDVKNALKGGEYDARTKGHRHNPPGRALGEGIYRILRHNTGKKTRTHLIYKLELPPDGDKNEPQESLNVEREGSFLIQIKNPDQQQQQHGDTSSQFGGTRSKRKAAVFPAHLQGKFGKLRYHPADTPEFLNYEGCEFCRTIFTVFKRFNSIVYTTTIRI
ncbi:hypothetical protein HYC85_024903 [Camellia sinensis]|uniref:Uncharacterized protein n=1 Tax=Camellia sinensis TaxID=4442 RepID=A0A7J7G9Z2_CAMSI|nr:hypothetical protein HYC85_024903 [Camellia sinensis]